MNLYEFEGKQILSNAGIHIPKSQLITSNKEKLGIKLPVMLKSQVLSGKRKRLVELFVQQQKKNIKKV